MMHIAFCTDTTYVMPTGIALLSVCENNKEEDITFHLVITDEGKIESDINQKVQPLLDIVAQYNKKAVVYRMAEEQIAQFVCSGEKYVSTTAFSRIFLPELLADDIKKVLYLDGDLVCDGSLKDLWIIELPENCPMGAVVDSNYASPSFHKIAEISNSAHYINSGVLLINLDYWRQHNCIKELVDVANEKKYPMLDQDTLNNVFQNKIKYLPIKYNLQLVTLLDGVDNCHVTLEFYDEIKDAIEKPVIIHYLTGNKPWKDERCPKREVWQRYKQLSVWRDVPTEHVITRFDRSEIHSEVIDTYWIDPTLFKRGLIPYLRFFQAAVRLKNKSRLISISSSILNCGAKILEDVYNFKVRKK